MFRDNRDADRFELAHEGGPSFCDYRIGADGSVFLTHVETPAPVRGHGHAADLMGAIVNHAKANKLKLRPICSYAVAYLRHRRDVADVMA